ncbi:MAG: hypothetical protein M1821_005772 [Bathelium mastoideum]|nr:MAG: hypothetical protein M1821_005772 [Bathelium mastoideum]
MASPPGPSGSPPYPPSLSLPQKRTTLHVPTPAGAPSAKRRKPSAASSVASAGTTTAGGGLHPLRQTSFPPEGAEAAGELRFSRSPSRESSVLIDGPPIGGGGGGARKKGRARQRRGGEDGGGAPGGKAGSVVAGSAGKGGGGGEDEAWGEEEAEEEGMGAQLLAVGGGLDSAAQAQEREHMDMLLSSFSEDQTSRYEAVRRVRLKKETVRRITNQTLSQSVPASVVTTINSFTKVFICELIERARDVQMEWMAAEEQLPTDDINPYWERRARELGKEQHASQATNREAINGHDQSDGNFMIHHSIEDSMTTIPDSSGTLTNSESEGDKRKSWVDPVQEMDRGPLTPDHLREALRRYKKDRDGGGAGLQGLSLDGRENTASRMGGRRLFR